MRESAVRSHFPTVTVHAQPTESGEPDHKEKEMTDSTNKPIDDSKEELSEAELDKVAGGAFLAPGVPEVLVNKAPIKPGKGLSTDARTTVGPE
jgi:hypothetical protein